MLVNVNYTKEVNACRECPYYYEDHDMGATIPICSKRTDNIILSNPNIIPNDCPIKEKKL